MNGLQATIALGGGGARGVAHLGAVQILKEAGIELSRIAGVSIGSLAGALCAFDPDTRRVQQKTVNYLTSPIFQEKQMALFGAAPGPGEESSGGLFSWYDRIMDFLKANRLMKRVLKGPALLPGAILQDVVDHLLPDADIADAVTPLSIVAVDLRTGHPVVLERGPLRRAVRASASIPGIFPPVEFGGMLLTDIGVFDSMPLMVARSYDADFVIGVDVSTDPQPVTECANALDVLMRMDEIGESLFRKHTRKLADLIIEPDVSHVEWFDFSHPDKLVEAGRLGARKALRNFRHFRVA